jgi:hypothetical protein
MPLVTSVNKKFLRYILAQIRHFLAESCTLHHHLNTIAWPCKAP